MDPKLDQLVKRAGKFIPVRRIGAYGTWGQSPVPNATTVTLDIAGEHITKQEGGNGPVDATFNAVMAACGISGTLEKFDVHTRVGVGSTGTGRVTIWLKHHGQTYKGIACGSNIELAHVDACVAVVNKMLRARRKQHRDHVGRHPGRHRAAPQPHVEAHP